MSLFTIIFYFFMGLAAVSALAILLLKDVFKAALCLLICLLSLAAIYVFSFAEFVAVTQTLIYAGGVIILIIFGIMLTAKVSGQSMKVTNSNVFSGILVSAALFILLIKFLTQPFREKPGQIIKGNSVYNTGIELMTTHALAFEFAGLLLLVALIGAAITATSNNKTKSL